MRAQGLLDTAREVCGDPDSRRRYDEAVGLRRRGGDLGQPGTGIESAGMAPADLGIIGEPGGGRSGRPANAGRLARPRRRRNRPVAVPDIRGLLYHAGLEAATRRGLHPRIVRLTERPMAVDGLVIDQHPRPPAKPHQGGTLTLQLWYPPARSR